MKKLSRCEICGNKKLDTVLNLGTHPLCDDLIKGGLTFNQILFFVLQFLIMIFEEKKEDHLFHRFFF